MTDVILVLTTVPTLEEGEAIAAMLIEERLAACVTVSGPLTSIYRWQGSVERTEERQLTIKTVRARLAAVEARVKTQHSYDVPELLVVSIEHGSDAYLRWIGAETHESA